MEKEQIRRSDFLELAIQGRLEASGGGVVFGSAKLVQEREESRGAGIGGVEPGGFLNQADGFLDMPALNRPKRDVKAVVHASRLDRVELASQRGREILGGDDPPKIAFQKGKRPTCDRDHHNAVVTLAFRDDRTAVVKLVKVSTRGTERKDATKPKKRESSPDFCHDPPLRLGRDVS